MTIPSSRPRSSSISSILSTSSISSSSSASSDHKTKAPFPFFLLPFELRTQILEYILCVPRVIDIDFNVSGITSIFLVSKRFHAESSAVFFGKNCFRLLPTHPQAASKRAQPLVRRFPATYRRLITRLELRLGPFWTNPPVCWKIDIKLGLKDLVRLRRLDVFVEVDPAHSMYKGYRRSEDFYTLFCGKLFESMLRRMPALVEVRLDGYSSVSPTGPLVQMLVNAAQGKKKRVLWAERLVIKRNDEERNLELGLISSALDNLSLQLLAPHA